MSDPTPQRSDSAGETSPQRSDSSQPTQADVPFSQPMDFTVSEADNIRRQDSDAAGWYRAVPFNPRP